MAKSGARGHSRGAAFPARLPALGTVGTADELAELLNLSARRVRQLVEQGMPRIEPGRYDLWRCARWYVAFLTRALAARSEPRSPKLARESLLLLSARRALRELRLGEARGELVSLNEVAGRWADAVLTLRARMVGAPARLASALVDLGTVEEARKVLAAEVCGALREADRIARARD